MASSGSGEGAGIGCCEHGHEISGSTLVSEFIEQLSDRQILQHDVHRHDTFGETRDAIQKDSYGRIRVARALLWQDKFSTCIRLEFQALTTPMSLM